MRELIIDRLRWYTDHYDTPEPPKPVAAMTNLELLEHYEKVFAACIPMFEKA